MPHHLTLASLSLIFCKWETDANSNEIVAIIHVNLKRMLISLETTSIVVVVTVVCADYISQLQLHLGFVSDSGYYSYCCLLKSNIIGNPEYDTPFRYKTR